MPDAASSGEGVTEALLAGASATMATAERLEADSDVGLTEGLVETPEGPLGSPSGMPTTTDDAMKCEAPCGTKRKAQCLQKMLEMM